MKLKKKKPLPLPGAANKHIVQNVPISECIHNAQTDGWICAQIVKTSPDIATCIVSWEILRDRHSPFFVTEFDNAFFNSLGTTQ